MTALLVLNTGAAVILSLVGGWAWLDSRRGPDDIKAVADAALAERPELADDTEAASRTLAAITWTDAEIAALAGLAAADGQDAAEPDALLVEIYTAQTKYRFKDIYGEDGKP